MDAHHLAEFLSYSPFFQEVEPQALASIATNCPIRELGSDEIVYGRGDASTSAFVVVQGEISLRQDGKEVSRRQPPDFFGEVAVWDGGPRLVEAVAVTQASVLELSKHVLADLLQQPGFAERMLRQVVSVMRKEI